MENIISVIRYTVPFGFVFVKRANLFSKCSKKIHGSFRAGLVARPWIGFRWSTAPEAHKKDFRGGYCGYRYTTGKAVLFGTTSTGPSFYLAIVWATDKGFRLLCDISAKESA